MIFASGCSAYYNKKAYKPKKESPDYHKDQAQDIVQTNEKNRDANEKHARKTQEKKQEALNETNRSTSKKGGKSLKKSQFSFY